MNWRKYIDKLLYNLKLKFKSKEELLTEEVLTFNFKYSDIKDINIKDKLKIKLYKGNIDVIVEGKKE